jgi:hypothetical protein
MAGAKEFAFQRAVMNDLKKNPDLMAWKTQHPPAGIPDIIVLGTNGLVCMFECKSYNGSPTARQKVVIERLRKLGIRTEVVRTLDKVHDTIASEQYRNCPVKPQTPILGGDGDGR